MVSVAQPNRIDAPGTPEPGLAPLAGPAPAPRRGCARAGERRGGSRRARGPVLPAGIVAHFIRDMEVLSPVSSR
jgi:hypothetical protein